MLPPSLTTMARATTSKPVRAAYRCSECGWQTAKWAGRCGECQAWGTVGEAEAPRARLTAPATGVPLPTPIGEVDLHEAIARPTGVDELDRVLGGGLVPGAVVLVAGEPGIGKSTLLLDVAARAGRDPAETRPVLYVSGEESAAQIRLRAERIGALAPRLHLAAETDLATVLGQLAALEPGLVVVDSVQTLASAEVEGSAGNVAQVREVAAALIQVAKARGIAVLLVGHVTKEGAIAGPRVLEHLVDVVLQFEGERHSRLRLVRAVKNRYGATDEVGCFDLSEAGIVGLPDPSGLFLTRREQPVPGSCVTVSLEGRRPLVAEVQTLVASTTGVGTPRRVVHGLDSSRVAMLHAVLAQHAGIRITTFDTYAATVGGVRVTEPACDLAVALGFASAHEGLPCYPDLVAIGEVGLAGEIRVVSGMPRRLAEAARLGFARAIVPVGTVAAGGVPAGLQILEVPDMAHAVAAALDVEAAVPTTVVDFRARVRQRRHD